MSRHSRAIAASALLELSKLGWYMQRGSNRGSGASQREDAPDSSGLAQRNLDTDIRGTYLEGGYETRRTQSRRDRKAGLSWNGRKSSHKHMRSDPALDTTSSGSDTWSSITDEHGGAPIT